VGRSRERLLQGRGPGEFKLTAPDGGDRAPLTKDTEVLERAYEPHQESGDGSKGVDACDVSLVVLETG